MMGFGGGMDAKTVPLGILIVEGDDVRAELFPEQPEENPTLLAGDQAGRPGPEVWCTW